MPEAGGINARVTVVVAIVGLIGAVAGAAVTGYFNQRAQISVERAKFEADLILKAIDTEDQTTAIKTLKFLADAGLIPSYEEKIRSLAEKDEGAAVPTLRSPSAYRSVLELEEGSEAARVASGVGLFTARGRALCTTFFVTADLALVPAYCLPEGGGSEGLSIRLGYDSADSPVRNLAVAEVEEGDAAGIAVLRVAADDITNVNPMPLRVREPLPGEAVYMIHHPRGGPKQFSENCALDAERPIAPAAATGMGGGGRDMLHVSCRTEGGSAGAPVIAVSDGAVLGVHVAGRRGSFERYAVPFAEIVKASAILRGLGRR
jgi:hypothetical protein